MATLEGVVECVRRRGWDAEIIVVDDGSHDTTADIVRSVAASAPESFQTA